MKGDYDEPAPVGALSEAFPSSPTASTVFANALDEFDECDDLDREFAFALMSHSSEPAPLSTSVTSRPVLPLPVSLSLSTFSTTTMPDRVDRIPRGS